MDRVFEYICVLAHIPGRANAAADFLSTIQTDPSQSLEIQYLDSITLKQNDFDMKTEIPDTSMLSIEWPETPQKNQFHQQYLAIYWTSYIQRTLYRILYLISTNS